jgi:hypothetical protein
MVSLYNASLDVLIASNAACVIRGSPLRLTTNGLGAVTHPLLIDLGMTRLTSCCCCCWLRRAAVGLGHGLRDCGADVGGRDLDRVLRDTSADDFCVAEKKEDGARGSENSKGDEDEDDDDDDDEEEDDEEICDVAANVDGTRKDAHEALLPTELSERLCAMAQSEVTPMISLPSHIVIQGWSSTSSRSIRREGSVRKHCAIKSWHSETSRKTTPVNPELEDVMKGN